MDLQRRYDKGWRNVSFVRSTKDVLARCMREKGVDGLTLVLCSQGYQTPSTSGKPLTNPRSPSWTHVRAARGGGPSLIDPRGGA